jgi:hypothetical protein
MMRKLLLATAAMLGGTTGLGGLAFAQAPAAPAPLPNMGTGAPFTATPSQTPLSPAPTTIYNGGGTGVTPIISAPGPGTLTVRIPARINAYLAAGSDSGRTPGTVTSSASSATSIGSPQTNTKLADYQFGSYVRFYPGVDGITANGLKYGGFIELRTDDGESPGGGVAGSISANSRNDNTVYVRVASTYIGTDQTGFLRFGSTYGAATLFITGTMENFNDGAWDGDLPGFFTGNTQITFPFPDQSALYTTEKIVYLSPQLFGFDVAASFAPGTNNGEMSSGNCPYAVTATNGVTGPIGGGNQPLGCSAASSTSSGDYTRPRNTVDAFVRYRGQFGPVGLAVEGGTIQSGKVLDNSTPAKAVQYNGYQIYDFGGQVTFGGLLVGGHITEGKTNGSFTLDPKGVKDSFAWVGGASYAIGPVIVGASYMDYMSAGAKSSRYASVQSPWVSNRNEWGIAAGGTFTFAPGMNIYLSYLYGHRKQLGEDILSGVVSSGTSASGRVLTHNNVQAQGISLGTQFRW